MSNKNYFQIGVLLSLLFSFSTCFAYGKQPDAVEERDIKAQYHHIDSGSCFWSYFQPYIGIGVHNTKIRLNDANRASYPEFQSNKIGGKLWLGLRVYKYFGFELAGSTIDKAKLNDNLKLSISTAAFDGLIYAPVHENVEFFIGPGLGWVRSKFSDTQSETHASFRWQAGFEYMFDRYIGGRLYYTHQAMNAAKQGTKRLTKMGVGLLYRF